MKGRPVFVGCVAVLVLTACGGAGVSAGSHPHTAVASSSVSVVGMSAPPSASVSVMGSEQAAAVESAAGKAIRDIMPWVRSFPRISHLSLTLLAVSNTG